jgi:RNA polymerase-binding transcription factor DksA
MDKTFEQEMKEQLEQLRDDVRETLEMEREEFDNILSETEIFDYPERAEALRDSDKLANLGLYERERLRQVLSALHKIESGEGYGVCETCSSPISKERLRAKPEAQECVHCQRRREQEGG